MKSLIAKKNYILVIDDDVIMSQTISDFIHEKGYHVIVCNNLEEAFSELSQYKIDLVLINFWQPDGTALILLEHLNEEKITTPVIVISNTKEHQSVLECFRMGVLDFVVKPINLEIFWYKVECLLTRVKLQHEVKLQRIELEKMLYEKAREEKMARNLFEHLVNIDNTQFEFVRTFCQASANFSGDIILKGLAPNGNFFLMLADSTGHGLSAAMPIMRVASTFRAMVSKGFSLATLIYELNSKVHRENPDDRFVACIVLEVDFFRKKIHIWNGGMPPVYIKNHLETETVSDHYPVKNVIKFKSTNMALGILPPQTFVADIATVDLPVVGHACLFSDGLIEQYTNENKPFGIETLNSLFIQHASELIPYLTENFKNVFDGKPITDDITVCTLDFERLSEWHQQYDICLVRSNMDGEFDWEVKLAGPMLLSAEYLNSLNQFLGMFGFATSFCQRVFTVVAELFSNAIDHGVLKLDSRLKSDPDGFELYHSIRDSSSARLTMNDWVKVSLVWCSITNELHICVADSGQGFKGYKNTVVDIPQLSGRGLSLVKTLSKTYELVSPGNITKVIME
ncbi:MULTISPECIES: fused response regulator/phosphatase [Shewanella]|uniref:Fused response regulator/phosphatase n=1 Tax=Shewanella scandinavica TaxID=3063538 RepID=A0ABU3G0R1_9GAMM|nr:MULTISPECIES: fused response regulator/phosphatase [unclassified Shewanella]MDT3280858.1 fused response regulator/phosphatase [Shewanella sp. SP2S1-2]MDT3319102.1 fused response regulator/phosphatase [Shewanella sp. SP1S2-4]